MRQRLYRWRVRLILRLIGVLAVAQRWLIRQVYADYQERSAARRIRTRQVIRSRTPRKRSPRAIS